MTSQMNGILANPMVSRNPELVAKIRAQFAQSQQDLSRQNMVGLADYLGGSQRRGDILSQNFRQANLQRGNLNEATAGMYAKGITNPGMLSRFQKSMNRDLAGSVYSAANDQTRTDVNQSAGILQGIYQQDVRTTDQRNQEVARIEAEKSNPLTSILGSIAGIGLGAVTGGLGGALGTSMFNMAKGWFDNSASGILGKSGSGNGVGLGIPSYQFSMSPALSGFKKQGE